MRNRIALLWIAAFLWLPTFSQEPLQGVSFSSLTITDKFWKPRLQTVATNTLDACIAQTEIKTPRIRNFEKIVNQTGEKHEGIYYDDSDVYKALEAIAYSLKIFPTRNSKKPLIAGLT